MASDVASNTVSDAGAGTVPQTPEAEPQGIVDLKFTDALERANLAYHEGHRLLICLSCCHAVSKNDQLVGHLHMHKVKPQVTRDAIDALADLDLRTEPYYPEGPITPIQYIKTKPGYCCAVKTCHYTTQSKNTWKKQHKKIHDSLSHCTIQEVFSRKFWRVTSDVSTIPIQEEKVAEILDSVISESRAYLYIDRVPPLDTRTSAGWLRKLSWPDTCQGLSSAMLRELVSMPKKTDPLLALLPIKVQSYFSLVGAVVWQAPVLVRQWANTASG